MSRTVAGEDSTGVQRPLRTNTSGQLQIEQVGDSAGDATAANQALQITQETAINTALGATGDAAVAAGATGSLSAKLRSISRDLVANIVLAAGSARIGKITIRNSADAADIDPLAESTFTGRIGEVQASPTSNTVLDRLKQLLTGIVLAAGANVIGAVTQSGTWTVQPGNTANTTPWSIKASRSSTGTHSNVASSASSVAILASNANRLGASIFNDSGAILYLDTTGGTASTTNYTLQLAPNSYFEMPFNYTGLITGIWASATGNARVVEYT